MFPLLGAPSSAAQPEKGLTRRQLLLRGTLAAGGLVVAGFVLKLGSLFEGPATGRQALSEREDHILGKLIEALLPPGGRLPPGDAGYITGYVDEFLAHADPEIRLLFRAMLHVIEDYARVTQLTRFTKLPLEARMGELRRWELTPVYLRRAGFSSVKILIGMAYFEQPEASRALGWYVGCAPPHLKNKSKQRLYEGPS